MAGHKEWIQQGLNDGSFLLAGSLQPELGGAVIAQGMSHQDIRDRVNEDPFVAENIVTAEILDFSPAMVDGRLDFLLTD